MNKSSKNLAIKNLYSIKDIGNISRKQLHESLGERFKQKEQYILRPLERKNPGRVPGQDANMVGNEELGRGR